MKTIKEIVEEIHKETPVNCGYAICHVPSNEVFILSLPEANEPFIVTAYPQVKLSAAEFELVGKVT